MIDLLGIILIVGLLIFTFFIFTTWLLIKYPKYANKILSKMEESKNLDNSNEKYDLNSDCVHPIAHRTNFFDGAVCYAYKCSNCKQIIRNYNINYPYRSQI